MKRSESNEHGVSQVELVVKNLLANAGDLRDTGSIPGSGRSPGEGRGNPLQCSCLENPRDGGAWWAAVYGVTQSWRRLKWRSSSSRCLRYCFYFFWIHRTGAAGSCNNSVFNFLRNHHTVFFSGCTTTFPSTLYRGPFSPHPHQHLLSIIFLIMDILICMRWYLIVVLNCISLMINDVEHFSCNCWPLLCLLLENVYSVLLPIFKLGFFHYWVVWVLYILDITHYQTYDGLPWWFNSKESTCNSGAEGDTELIPGSGRSSGGRHSNPLQVFLPGESHGQRNPMVGYSPWVHRELHMTEVT